MVENISNSLLTSPLEACFKSFPKLCFESCENSFEIISEACWNHFCNHVIDNARRVQVWSVSIFVFFLAKLAFVKFQVEEFHTTCTTLYSASFGSIWCVAPLGSWCQEVLCNRWSVVFMQMATFQTQSWDEKSTAFRPFLLMTQLPKLRMPEQTTCSDQREVAHGHGLHLLWDSIRTCKILRRCYQLLEQIWMGCGRIISRFCSGGSADWGGIFGSRRLHYVAPMEP